MSRRKYDKRKTGNSFPYIWIFAGALVFVLTGVGIWIAGNSTESGAGQIGPRLEVNQERLDLGRQPFDKMVRAEFAVKNSGDRSLTLDASTPVRVVEGC